MRKSNGFTLVEMIVALAIFGILAMGFAGLLQLGVRGYASSTTNSAQALIAQIAFDRISMELKNIDPYSTITLVQAGSDISIQYVNSRVDSSGATRTIFYDDSEGRISINGFVLVEDLDSNSFQLSVNTNDMNNDGDSTNEVSDIFLSFRNSDNTVTMSGRIYPRAIAEYSGP
ncbi:MAG: prepilin-type N-terminal cleavage/methylation domain-containing protein [Desulfovibrio sp.]|nr:MAG: prepilin-type N-terminal cleavage/methylation domain-containing protein [Desulfovibrio sp.]